MDTSLDSLDPKMKPLALALISKCEASGIPIRVINTRRTATEQAINVKNGVSWVKHSKHQDGMAIDICPVELLATKNWSPQSALWQTLGKIGKELGLIWGGDWKKRDMGHFEL